MTSVKFVSITQGAKNWTGVDVAGAALDLLGVPNVTLSVSGGAVKVNQATGAAKLDWTTFSPTGMSLPHLDIGQDLDLHVSGSAKLQAYGVLIALGTIDLDEGQVTDTNTVGTDAEALSFELKNAQAFAGSGGVLSGTTIDTSNAIGVDGKVKSLKVVSISQGEKSWLGIDASGVDASLVGVPNVTLSFTGGSTGRTSRRRVSR
ncbi:MAG: hypothetical protein E6G67_11940 [Actinobacteria bacterium]|nr:MAG: hypothetical protein E6G67_11940 [Actinomycetota bacterium]